MTSPNISADTWVLLSGCTLSPDASYKAQNPVFIHPGFKYYEVQIAPDFQNDEYMLNIKCIQTDNNINKLVKGKEQPLLSGILEAIDNLTKSSALTTSCAPSFVPNRDYLIITQEPTSTAPYNNHEYDHLDYPPPSPVTTEYP